MSTEVFTCKNKRKEAVRDAEMMGRNGKNHRLVIWTDSFVTH